MHPLGPSGIPLIPCPECQDEVVEFKSRKNKGKNFFKCVKFTESLGENKCPFFRWIEEYKQEVAKKVKKDLKVAGLDPSEGENEAVRQMKHRSPIYDEDKTAIKLEKYELKMDKLIVLVQLLVVLCLIMNVIALLGVVVLICK
ncbi:hypothetical protein PVAP13_8NG259500 [Panicum virgatum]|uniref:GRF-type domain-containing protein n=1 Tax=Panicum virgatum TaxID=38727 RepID=A0A8T0PA54_PANVG|nr:hypothetical protein PVAP13_8NG259500 [Panicum virgatum]